MTSHSFRPSIARVQNAQKAFTSTKTNATIRDLEEEEGELEEKEGFVVSIDRNKINGEGWTVEDDTGQIYVCSCASSMYEIPKGIERGGILYPEKNTVKVTFTINPVLRINAIKEIKSLGNETEKLDISKWTHKKESTTVIAKPKSALSISDGFIRLSYDNNNEVLANNDAVKTEGKKTEINTESLSINSSNVSLGGQDIKDVIQDNALSTSNSFKTFDIDSPISVIANRTNNMTELHVSGKISIADATVIGQIKDQASIPVRKQTQFITDGNCVDKIVIDTDGVITIEPVNGCTKEREFDSTHNWVSPQVLSRNYLKVIVKHSCNYCDEGNNTEMEYINYCPKCGAWNVLVDTGTSIRCSECAIQFCQNCGKDLTNQTYTLRKYSDNNVSVSGTTCKYCNSYLEPGTTKQFVNYCPNCRTWGNLSHTDILDGEDVVSVLKCICGAKFCGTCGIDQDNSGIALNNSGISKYEYDNALRKLKYIKEV